MPSAMVPVTATDCLWRSLADELDHELEDIYRVPHLLEINNKGKRLYGKFDFVQNGRWCPIRVRRGCSSTARG